MMTQSYQENTVSFHEAWPLHVLRYLLMLIGVFTWLWEQAATDSMLKGAILFSLLLLIELPLYGPDRYRSQKILIGLQIVFGIFAFLVTPGLPAALVLCAVVTGAAVIQPLVWAAVSCTVVCVTAFLSMPTVRDFPVTLSLTSAYAVSVWTGRMFALRIKEGQEHRRTVTELQEAQRRITQFAETTRKLAAAQERERLTEEIHDTLGHALVASLLQIQVAKKLVTTDSQAALQRLDLVEQSVRQTLESVRHYLRRGRPGREQLALNVALEGLTADFQAAGGPQTELQFKPDAQSVADVSPQVADALYRTVQEAMTNAVRHGDAHLVRISAEAVGPRLYLQIEDDGVGAGSYTPGIGLSGVVRRIQELGGTLRFHTALGEGFQIEVGVKRW